MLSKFVSHHAERAKWIELRGSAIPDKYKCHQFGAFTAGAVTAGMMAANAAVIGLIGVAVSVYGTMQQSKAAKNQAKFQQAQADQKAEVGRRNARAIEAQGKVDANKHRARDEQGKANELISMVAQGGDITSGSNIDLLADYAGAGEQDALQVEDNANRKGYNARVNAGYDSNQANLFGAKAASINPGMDGATTAISGLSSVASNWAFSGGGTNLGFQSGGGAGGNSGLYQTSTANFNYNS